MVELSDLEVERIKRERADLDLDRVKRFSILLKQFAGSSRYAVLRSLRLSFFMSEDVLDVAGFEDSTLDELVELGCYEVCAHPVIGNDLLDKFNEIFSSLLDADGAADTIVDTMYSTPPGLSAVGGMDIYDESQPPQLLAQYDSQPTEKTIPGPVLSSIEVEQKLIEGFNRIRNHPELAALGQHLVGEYWEDDWLRAPFVEALTFQQLVGMQLPNLLEKRMINNQKVLGILHCIDRVCAQYDSNRKEEGSLPTPFQPIRTEVREGVPWVRVEKNPPILLEAFIALYEKNYAKSQSQSHWLSILPSELSNAETGWVVARQILGEDVLATLLGLEIADVQSENERLIKKIKRATKKFDNILLRWERLLQSGAVSIELLMPDGVDVEEHSLTKHLMGVFVESMGAEQPCIEDVVLEGCWTLRPKAIKQIWKSILAEKGASKKSFVETCEALLPHVSHETIEALYNLQRTALKSSEKAGKTAKRR